MKANNNVTTKKEWSLVILDIFRFFLQHTNIEFDGYSKTVKVKYDGPNGWKFSIDTAYQPVIDVQSCIEEE